MNFINRTMKGEFSPNASGAGGRDTVERLELALRASNEGIWDWTVGEEEIYYSDRIYAFFGREKGELPNIFITPEALLPPHEVEVFKLELEAKLQAGSDDLLALDCAISSPDTVAHWLRIRGVIVRDDSGRAVRMAGSMIDISRRKFAESKAEEEHHLLRLLIDNVPLSVFFKDLKSRFTLVNHRMVKWMGYDSEDQLTGKCDHDLFSAEHAEAALADELKVMTSKEPILDQVEEETWSEKESTYVQTSKFPLQDRSGTVIGTFGVSSDVTELVRTQQQLAEVALKLKKRNEEVEEELTLAREIQQSFANPENRELNSASSSWEASFGTFYLPISGMAGDFHEIIHIREGVVGLLVCDVMGHGVRSALVVSMLRGLMERERDHIEDPGHFLGGLNEGLSRILTRASVTMFATAFYAVIDLNEGKLTYANAGHPAAIVRSGDQAFGLPMDGIRGVALGIISESHYENGHYDLEKIDHLVMFTDGCFEVENNADEALMEEGFVDLVAQSEAGDVNALLHGVVDGVMNFAGESGFEDDVCLLGMSLRSLA